MSDRRNLPRVVGMLASLTALASVMAVAAEPPESSKPATKPEQKPGPTHEQAPKPFYDLMLPPSGTAVPLTPLPPTPIPDDPPPHEGAMIDIPLVIEPPDLVMVEVLEALPGRPISGERLVRPDGTIHLGFYGVVHVRGLTPTQAKVKVIEQLRRFLPDAILGLEEYVEVAEEAPATGPQRPDAKVNPFELGPRPKASTTRPADPTRQGRPVRRTSTPDDDAPVYRRSNPASMLRLSGWRSALARQEQPVATVISPGGGVKITIEVGPQPAGASAKGPNAPPPELEKETGFKKQRIRPEDSIKVFIDITAYNSKFYYIQGDVAAPGKMPFTGKETVLDALNYACGLIATSDRRNIRLIRPARGGKPTRIYTVDLAAIENGDPRQNYQLFPGDRLVVGRDPLIASTILHDRQSSLFQTLANSVLQLSFLSRSFTQATPDLTPSQRESALREWFDLWWKSTQKPGGPVPDEATFRELILKQLKGSRGPVHDEPAKK